MGSNQWPPSAVGNAPSAYGGFAYGGIREAPIVLCMGFCQNHGTLQQGRNVVITAELKENAIETDSGLYATGHGDIISSAP